MTANAVPVVKDKDLLCTGLVESATVNSIFDFTPSKLTESMRCEPKSMGDFTNTFICHLIFYVIFCVSIVLHILIDLGLASFTKNTFSQLFDTGKKTFFETPPALAL